MLQEVGSLHFKQEPQVGFLELFFPIKRNSQSRARAFLWLLHYYLEGPNTPNPYDDEYSHTHPGAAPLLVPIDEAEYAREVNIDTPEELEWAEHMKVVRARFLQKLMEDEEHERTQNRRKPARLPYSDMGPGMYTVHRDFVVPHEPIEVQAASGSSRGLFSHFIPLLVRQRLTS